MIIISNNTLLNDTEAKLLYLFGKSDLSKTLVRLTLVIGACEDPAFKVRLARLFDKLTGVTDPEAYAAAYHRVRVLLKPEMEQNAKFSEQVEAIAMQHRCEEILDNAIRELAAEDTEK